MARAQTTTGGRDATAAVIPGRYALSVGMPNLPAPEGWKWTPLSSVARLESGHTPSRPDGEEVPLAIETSRLLFGVDREAYKLVLNACREAKAAVPQDAEVA